MSERDTNVALRQMLDAARRASEIATERERVDLERDDITMLALSRLIEIVGEASRRVPEAFRAEHSEIPWRQSQVPGID